MLYTILVPCFVICVASLSNTNSFRPISKGVSNDSVLLNVDGGKVGGKVLEFFRRQQPLTINNRQRRSIWTKIIDHIAEVVETFHREPQLAESINDFDRLNINLKEKSSDSSKSVNFMLSKGVGNDNELPKGEVDADDTKEEDYIKPKEVDHVPLNESLAIQKEMKSLIKLNDLAIKKEEHIIKTIKDHGWEDMEEEYLSCLISNKKTIESEKFLHDIITKFPEVKNKLVKEFAQVKQVHMDIQKRYKAMVKQIGQRDLGEDDDFDLYNLKEKMDDVTKKNDQWLESKSDGKILRNQILKLKIKSILDLYKKAEESERELLQTLVNLDWEDLETEHYQYLFKDTIDNEQSERLLSYIVDKFPDYRNKVELVLDQIKELREKLQNDIDFTTLVIEERDRGENIKKLLEKLNKIRKLNEKWLEFIKNTSEFRKEEIDKKTSEYAKVTAEELKKKIEHVIRLHMEADIKEKKLLKSVADSHFGSSENYDLSSLHENGINNVKTENLMHEVINKFPAMKNMIMNEIASVKWLREEIHKEGEALAKITEGRILGKNLDELNRQLESIKKVNAKWLEHKTDPEFTKMVFNEEEIKNMTIEMYSILRIYKKIHINEYKLIEHLMDQYRILDSDNLGFHKMVTEKFKKLMEDDIGSYPKFKEAEILKIVKEMKAHGLTKMYIGSQSVEIEPYVEGSLKREAKFHNELQHRVRELALKIKNQLHQKEVNKINKELTRLKSLIKLRYE